MSVTDTHFDSPHGSVFAVLELAHDELRELQSQHDQLTRRIRSVRSAVNALRRLSADGQREAQDCCDRTVDNGRHDESLIRACRIALLEADEALSVDEIHARIMRRGSFPDRDAASLKPAIAQHLESMAVRGEVLRVVTAAQTKWQRT